MLFDDNKINVPNEAREDNPGGCLGKIKDEREISEKGEQKVG